MKHLKLYKNQFGFLGSLIGGALSFIGGERRNSAQSQQANQANQFSANQTEEQRAFNKKEAQLNRDFQERLSNTAHRREAIDMKAAGINRILTGYGKGASQPSGSTATSGAATGQQANIQDSISPAVSQALQISSAQAGIRLQNSQATKNEAETQNIKDTNPNIHAEGKNITARTNQAIAQSKNIQADTSLKGKQEMNVVKDGLLKDIDAKIKQTQNKTEELKLTQLKTKTAQLKAEETFWLQVGSLAKYAAGALGLAGAASTISTIIDAKVKRKGVKQRQANIQKLRESNTLKSTPKSNK